MTLDKVSLTLARLWVTLGRLWVTLARLWATLGRLWVTLARLWGDSGQTLSDPGDARGALGKLWVTLGKLWVTLGKLWVILGRLWVTLGGLWVILSTSEVKQHRARSVLGWGTAWEDLSLGAVGFFASELCISIHAHICVPQVRALPIRARELPSPEPAYLQQSNVYLEPKMATVTTGRSHCN